MANQYRVAVCGATGAVGNQMIKCLEERNFPIRELRLLASERSRGKVLNYQNNQIPVQVLGKNSFFGIDIALFSAGGSISEKWAPLAVANGAVVIDNSSVWRMDPAVPLVVPEVNPQHIIQYKNKGIIANPNCSTIQMVVVLKPIHDVACIERVVVVTYQAVSGTGQKAIIELMEQTQAYVMGRPIKSKVYPYQIAFNLIPHIGMFKNNGYTEEEMKMVFETQKIMNSPAIKISATCVRVPVVYGHSEAINITTTQKISSDEIRAILSKVQSIKVIDDLTCQIYPMPLDVAGKDFVLVGRIREDISQEQGIDMWISADNIRKGAATNAVQIAEILIQNYL